MKTEVKTQWNGYLSGSASGGAKDINKDSILFQMSGPATKNALRPNWVLVCFMTAARVVDDQRHHTTVSLSLNVTLSIRYAGQQRCRQWCISVASLNKALYLTGSQCGHFNAGVTRAHQSRPSTSRAVTFCTHCTGASDDSGRIASMALQTCSSQCEWWLVIAPVELSHCDQRNYRTVGSCLRWCQQMLATFVMWPVTVSSLWKRTLRLRTTSEHWTSCRTAVNGVGPVS